MGLWATTGRMKIPLIPTEKPVPQVMRDAEEAKAKGRQMTKKVLSAPNVEDPTQKPDAVRAIWAILSKMDPEGSMFVADKGLVLIDGEGPQNRTPTALGLTDDEAEALANFAVYDSDTPDDPSSARATIVTIYQLLELAYAMGSADTEAQMTGAMVDAAEEGEEEAEDEGLNFDPDNGLDDDGDDDDDDDDDD